MREILFRGKCVDTGNWYEGQYIHLHKTTYCFAGSAQRDAENEIHQIVFEQMTDWNLPNRHLRVDVIPETVGQYTGLTANGKKIFEGDIVAYLSDDGTEELTVVAFDEKEARFVQKSIDEDIAFETLPGYDVTIVGNIHDNPELLKG